MPPRRMRTGNGGRGAVGRRVAHRSRITGEALGLGRDRRGPRRVPRGSGEAAVTRTVHRTVFVIIVMAWVAAMTQMARAQGTGECSSVRDFEKRQACIAIRDGNAAECNGLRNADARALCRMRAQSSR